MTLVQEIESIYKTEGNSYIDAVVFYSNTHNIEIELLAEFIKKDPVLTSKLRYEAENLNILKKGARLPV